MKNLVKYDVYFNDDLQKKETIRFCIFIGIWILSFGTLTYFLIHDLPKEDKCANDDDDICRDNINILYNILLLSLSFILTGLCAGVLGIKKGLNVGYTRKTLHFVSFFMPFAVNKIIPVQSHFLITVLKFLLIIFVYLIASKPVRRKFWLSLIMFRAIDRPDDRPYTLKWLITQFFASSIVIVPFSFLWESWEGEFGDLALIVVIINGLGDGLAEPVGVKFGKHKYRTRALWYDEKFCSGSFTRSIEGSSVVFLVSIIAIAAFYDIFTTIQLIVAFLTVPIVMTLTEAFSPRTWDSPFLFLIGASLLSAIVQID